MKRKKPTTRRRTNASTAQAETGTLIYPRIIAIHAQRRRGSKTVYVHKFTTTNPVIGLPDGSLLIPAGARRLWGEA